MNHVLEEVLETHDLSAAELREETAPSSASRASVSVSKSPKELARIVVSFASSPGWLNRVRLCVEHRWYERLYLGPDYDIWVISWLPGQSTGFHDHGGSSGAFVVATGVLEEHRSGQRTRVVHPGEARTFGADYAHDVRNGSLAPAISIHAYSPPLTEMNEYELEGSELIPREQVSGRANQLEEDWREARWRSSSQAVGVSIEHMLSAARARLQRLSPEEAHAAMAEAGTVLVDIRPAGQRALEGTIPGALLVERNVLEWRFDPTSSARLPVATDHSLQVIVFCSEGYTSSLAAASLKDLGLFRATDIIGGFGAWRRANLPFNQSGETSKF